MIRALIIDDEKPSRDELKFLLSEIENIELIGEAEDGVEALKIITRYEPDLLFLDIRMPEISGIELAESIEKMKNKPRIIFTTAYDSFAVQAFDVGAHDYILKPYDKARLAKSINRLEEDTVGQDEDVSSRILETLRKYAAAEQSDNYLQRITVIRGDTYHPLKPEDIIAVIASGKKTRLVTEEMEYEDNRTISSFEELLGHCFFFRCHRSYIINLNYIDKIGLWFNNTYQLSMKNLAERVPVSRSRVKEFRKLMSIE